MGRPPSQPFLIAAQSYLADVRPYIADSTWTERSRKLRFLARTFADFRARDLIETTDPAKMGEQEIGAFVAWMRERRFELAYQAKLMEHLKALLAHVGNGIVDRMKALKHVRFPKRVDRPIYAKDEAWLREAGGRLDGVEGWPGTVVRFALAFYSHSGLRSKELRLVRVADLDMTAWSLSIEHPKGEGAWASAGERIAIFPSLRPHVLDYLDARTRRLRDLGLDPETVEALIPNESGRFYSESGWSGMRVKVFRKAGIRGNYRILRPSFAQRLKDLGAPIEAVSRALRHSSTATTERFYARIRTERAWDDLEQLWETPAVQLKSP